MQIKHDLDQLEKKLGKMERGLIPKAASQAINKSLRSVNTAAIRAVSEETTIKQKEIRQDHELQLANRNRLHGVVDAKKARARNLIHSVRPSLRKPNHFNARNKRGGYRAPGVKAKAWGKTKVYRGSFIQRVSNGELLVLARKDKTGPRGGTTKGLIGPSPRGTFKSQRLQRVMERQARERFRVELTRSINNELRKLQ
ncbi:phage tail protein [Microbulbifer spongiae]|uniref:Phage tail protein n=1 Tax=Microbulbifer spongiae TaxID=2944933 RepID=A0ABY9E5V9_9GAMM|nr:phage tail protein [Microbulbifer sp. MI-G]WKD48403.1 phage tail protein [Microbulbifer sp. MI-G]